MLTERALSNEIITPGRTSLEDVAWWLQDRLLERGLESEFDMPSVYLTGPEGIAAVSTARIIQPGDVIMIDDDIGPSLTTWQPLQATFELHPHHILSFEYFAYTPIAEWGGRKLRIPTEDDAILMEGGIQFVHPANYRLLVIR